MDIKEIRKRSKIHVKFTDHARIEMLNDNIRVDDIFAVIDTGEIIEQYSDDKPFPSCLVYAKVDNRPIHVVCAMPEHVDILIVVTTYLPDPINGSTIRQEKFPERKFLCPIRKLYFLIRVRKR